MKRAGLDAEDLLENYLSTTYKNRTWGDGNKLHVDFMV